MELRFAMAVCVLEELRPFFYCVGVFACTDLPVQIEVRESMRGQLRVRMARDVTVAVELT